MNKSFKTKIVNKSFFSPVCHLLRLGVAALFGPESGTTSTHIQVQFWESNILITECLSSRKQLSLNFQSICDAMEIPHIGECYL